MIAKLRSWWWRFLDNCSWEKANPLNWTSAEIKLFVAFFLALMLPIYVYIGLQPAPIANAASYPQLEISSINLKTPVASIALIDRQLTAPATIAGVYQSAINKTFIIGHSSTVFKNLSHAQVGDTIAYDEQTYIIKNIETLQKSDIDMREILQPESTETMIIMTCAGEPLPNQDATHRLIITANLVTTQ